MRGWRVLKTTQSGYEGFLKDPYTALPDTRDRIAATEVHGSWRLAGPVAFDAAYASAMAALASTFFGPPSSGTYSPSLQYTLARMAEAVLDAVPGADSVHLLLPNLHFIPANPPGGTPFADDVYVATSEPHGTIEATVVRGEGVAPHVDLWGGGAAGLPRL